jgi:hypothetical protein
MKSQPADEYEGNVHVPASRGLELGEKYTFLTPVVGSCVQQNS